MDLRCPKCNSSDLKKVSLAYQEGLYRSESQSRLRAVVVGGGGPDMVVGRTTTQGSQQSALSKKLCPAVKWSYGKLVFWSVLVFMCGGWLVFYVNTITKNSTTVTSPALTVYVLIASVIFVVLLLLVGRRNHSTYAREYADWDRSVVCQRCGTVFVR